MMSEWGALVRARTGGDASSIEAPEGSRWRRRGRGPKATTREEDTQGRRQRRGMGPFGGRAVLLVAAVAAAAGALLSAGVHAGGVAFSGRIAAGCDELAECRSLEAEAERRAARCVLFCGRASAEHRAARLMRYRAEERQAVRDHYRAREQAEQLELERARTRASDERQRRDSARAQEAAREQHERLELERLRQAHVDRRLAEERRRRVGYFVALGLEGRSRRLEQCLRTRERCDALALELLEAAPDADERRALAQLNERLTSLPSATPSGAGTGGAAATRARDEQAPSRASRVTRDDAESSPARRPQAEGTDGRLDAGPRVEVVGTTPLSAAVPRS